MTVFCHPISLGTMTELVYTSGIDRSHARVPDVCSHHCIELDTALACCVWYQTMCYDAYLKPSHVALCQKHLPTCTAHHALVAGLYWA